MEINHFLKNVNNSVGGLERINKLAPLANYYLEPFGWL